MFDKFITLEVSGSDEGTKSPISCMSQQLPFPLSLLIFLLSILEACRSLLNSRDLSTRTHNRLAIRRAPMECRTSSKKLVASRPHSARMGPDKPGW